MCETAWLTSTAYIKIILLPHTRVAGLLGASLHAITVQDAAEQVKIVCGRKERDANLSVEMFHHFIWEAGSSIRTRGSYLGNET